MTLLRVAVSYERAWARQVRYARALLDGGVAFSNEYAASDPAVVAFVRANVPGSEGFLPNDEPGALVALDDSDSPIGAAVVVLHTIGSGDLVLYLWQVAVDPGWQRRGVGTVLLGTLPQRVGARPEVIRDHGAFAGTFGACASEQAGFYQHAGFDVSCPGVPLALSGAPRAIRASAGAKQSCWMVRGW